MKRLKVGFLSAKNYLDERTFSGTLYSMYRSLSSRDLDVVPLGHPTRSRVYRRLLRLLRHRQWMQPRAPTFRRDCEQFVAQVGRQMRRRRCDVLFAPVASYELFRLDSEIPVVYVTDAACASLQQLYQFEWTDQEEALRYEMENIAVAKAAKIVVSSHWAADSLITGYGADPHDVEVVDFGPNIEDVPPRADSESDLGWDECQLLFVGVPMGTQRRRHRHRHDELAAEVGHPHAA